MGEGNDIRGQGEGGFQNRSILQMSVMKDLCGWVGLWIYTCTRALCSLHRLLH